MKFERYILAEVGSVHDGSFGNACKLIEMAAQRGASAVKFQTHIAQHETLDDAPSPPYFNQEPRKDYFDRTAFTLEQWKNLADHCVECNVHFVSSPFSIEAVELLEQTSISAYKVASGEVSNLPLLERIVETGKPVFLSSGMSNWTELDAAVEILRKNPLIVMQCSSQYPCPFWAVGINVMEEMSDRYSLPVGFSDHTLSDVAAILAVGHGAVAIEKHVTFSRAMYGSDAPHSCEPDEFNRFTLSLRDAWAILDHPVQKHLVKEYDDMKNTFEKSIVTKRNLKAGHVLTMEDLAFKKPGDGIKASLYKEVLGTQLLTDVDCNHKLEWRNLD